MVCTSLADIKAFSKAAAWGKIIISVLQMSNKHSIIVKSISADSVSKPKLKFSSKTLVVTSRKINSNRQLTLGFKIFIVLFILAAALVACGPRSGVTTDNNEAPTCGVIEQTFPDTNRTTPTTNGENGRRLFKTNCAVCHAPMDINPETGKNLRDVLDRLPKPTEAYLKKFIQDSYSLRKTDNGYANMIKEKSKVDYEHDFKGILSEKEVQDIIEYITFMDNPID